MWHTHVSKIPLSSSAPQSIPVFLPICRSVSSFILPSGSPLHLSVLSWLTVSIATLSLNPTFLTLFLTPLRPVPAFPPLSFQVCQFLPLCVYPLLILPITPSVPLWLSFPFISFCPLIHIHPLFYILHDVCPFIHLSLSLTFSSPLPHPLMSHTSSFLCPFQNLSLYVLAPYICPRNPLPFHSLPLSLCCLLIIFLMYFYKRKQYEINLKDSKVIKSHWQRQLHRRAITSNPLCICFDYCHVKNKGNIFHYDDAIVQTEPVQYWFFEARSIITWDWKSDLFKDFNFILKCDISKLNLKKYLQFGYSNQHVFSAGHFTYLLKNKCVKMGILLLFDSRQILWVQNVGPQ